MITTIMSGAFVLINSMLKTLKGASSIHSLVRLAKLPENALAPTSVVSHGKAYTRARLLQPSKRSGGPRGAILAHG